MNEEKKKIAEIMIQKLQEQPSALISVAQSDYVLYAAYLLIGLAVFFIVQMLMREEEERVAQESLEENKTRPKNVDLILKITRPLFTQYVLPKIRGKNYWDNKRVIYRRKLITGGCRNVLSPDEFISWKILQIPFFPVVFLTLRYGEILQLSTVMIILTSVLGWYYPDIWLNRLIKARQKLIRRSMPFIVDLLALSTEAGLDFIGAIQKVVEKAKPSPLVDEFEQLLKEIKLGSSRSDAMRELSIRVGMPEINSFIAVLISAEQMGAPVGKILKDQSEQIRSARFMAAEKAGEAAGQKLMLPLALLIFPAVLLLVGAPFAIPLLTGQ